MLGEVVVCVALRSTAAHGLRYGRWRYPIYAAVGQEGRRACWAAISVWVDADRGCCDILGIHYIHGCDLRTTQGATDYTH